MTGCQPNLHDQGFAALFLPTSFSVDFPPVQNRPGFESPWARETYTPSVVANLILGKAGRPPRLPTCLL